MITKLPPNELLKPSGVNSTFHGGDGTFQDYIQHMQTVIANGRRDLNSPQREKIIAANSPYELRPDKPTRKGILLIHGLYDSPFTMRDMAEHLARQNFLVRSILLPGHGTVPGDLLNIHYQEWIKATAFGVKTLEEEVDEIYILGYSTGSTLALDYALAHPSKIKALVLIAPALKPRRHFVDLSVWAHKFMALFFKTKKWYQLVQQTSYARYESFTCNAAEQACHLMKITRRKSYQSQLTIPLFMSVTSDDESVNSDTAINFFLKQRNNQNRLLLYSNEAVIYNDDRITVQKAAYPEHKILDLAHTGIAISPHNIHYGFSGDFKDFQHYYYDTNKYNGDIYLGAISSKNIHNYIIQRLSFNPDFDEMSKRIMNFLATIG